MQPVFLSSASYRLLCKFVHPYTVLKCWLIGVCVPYQRNEKREIKGEVKRTQKSHKQRNQNFQNCWTHRQIVLMVCFISFEHVRERERAKDMISGTIYFKSVCIGSFILGNTHFTLSVRLRKTERLFGNLKKSTMSSKLDSTSAVLLLLIK